MDTTQISSVAKAHAIFESPDILPNIFYFLNSEARYDAVEKSPSSITARKNLRSAALTSKAFFGPASSVLWRTLNSVLPVLKLVPGFVFLGNGYTINHTITSERRETLESYGSKVRNIYLTEIDEFMNVKVHAVIYLLNLENPLFPNLHTLHIHSSRVLSETNLVFLVLSKSLTSLSIGGMFSTEDDIIGYLSLLAQKTTLLQDLSLEGDLTNRTLRAIHTFQQLKSVNLTLSNEAFHFSFLQPWGNLQSLTRLSINLNHCRITSLNVASSQTVDRTIQLTDFQALEELQLAGHTEDILYILRYVASSKTLNTITMQISFGPFPVVQALNTNITDIIEESVRISQVLASFSIRTLEQAPTSQSEKAPITIPEESILLLSRCTRLESVEFTGVSILVKDSTFREVEVRGVSNWGNMRILRLPEAPSKKEAPSIQILVIIAWNCPNLVELRICVGIGLITIDSYKYNTAPHSRMIHKLEKLYFVQPRLIKGHSSKGSTTLDQRTMMGKAIAISRLIEYHFPLINTIASYDGSSTDANLWWAVAALVFDKRNFRKHVEN